MAVVLIDGQALAALVESLDVSEAVEDFAEEIAAEVRDFLSEPAPRPRPRRAYNPPPGPPHLVSGDLVASIQVEPVGGGEFDITADAEHRGVQYAQVLKDRGYLFHPNIG